MRKGETAETENTYDLLFIGTSRREVAANISVGYDIERT